MKECPKTVSGKHIWEVRRRFSRYNEILKNITVCIACGIIDDTKDE